MKKTIYAILFLLIFVTNISIINAGVFTNSYNNGDLISTCRYYFKGTNDNIINYEDKSGAGIYALKQDSAIPYIAEYFGKEKIATLRIYHNTETKNIKFQVTANDGKVTSISYQNNGQQWTDANLLECPKNLYQYVPKGDAETAFNLSDLYVKAGSKIIVQQQFYGQYFQIKYEFDGKLNSQNSSHDVYFSDIYELARKGEISIEKYASKNQVCTYALANDKNLTVSIGQTGKTSVAYSGDEYTEGKYAFVKYVEANGKCPVSVCFNPGSDSNINGTATSLTLSSDIKANCTAVGATDTTNTAEDRTQKETSALPTMTTQDYEAAKAKVADFKKAFSNYLECIIANDTDSKCGREKTEYSAKCSATADAVKCNESQKQLLTCMDTNYAKTSYNSGCETLKAEYEKAYKELDEYQKRTGNVFITGMIEDIDQSLNLGELTCEELFGDDLLSFITTIFRVIQIGGVLLVVVLSMLDFMNAVSKGDDDAMKKASKRLKTRLIVIILLIVLPTLIEFILETFNDALNLNNTNPLCK